MPVPVIMKSPDDYLMLLQQILFLLQYFVVQNPVDIIFMVVKCRFMGYYEIGIHSCGIFNHFYGGKHGGYDAGYLLAGVSAFNRINGMRERSPGNFFENEIDDFLNR